MTNDALSIDAAKFYEELGQNYRYFLGWRERLFAGYITVLAGLGLGFAMSGRTSFEIGLLVAAILVSVVFLILDQRTRDLFQQCQLVGRDLEKLSNTLGVYTALQSLVRPVGSLTTHSLAVKLLVGGVVGGSITGLFARVPEWLSLQRHGLSLVAGAAAWIIITVALEKWYAIGTKWPINK